MADFFVVAVMLVALELSRHTGSDDYLIGNFMVTQRNLLKRKTPKRFIMKHFGVLQVVPPEIVIYFQVVEYHSFLKTTQL